MKTKISSLLLLGTVAIFTVFNVCMSQTKNGKKMSLFNALLQLQPLEVIAEAEVFPENFPEDKWEGSGPGAKICEITNYYIYNYIPSGKYFMEYTYPVTRVNCIGSGEIPCISNMYIGDGVLTRIVTEDQKMN